tara:strand:- start:5637 stop:6101 length:465 start_codon:yes stop_codon:yes gene_type:complete
MAEVVAQQIEGVAAEVLKNNRMFVRALHTMVDVVGHNCRPVHLHDHNSGCAMFLIVFLRGLMWGKSMMTMATKPISASRMTSRKTVPVESSSSNSSSSDTPFSHLDDGVDQVDRPGSEHSVIDDKPLVQHRSDKRGLERYGHALDPWALRPLRC